MSRYAGYKDCLVISYEGNVKVNNIPQNTRRSKVVEVARQVLQEKLNKPLTGLNNIEYYKGNEIQQVLEKIFYNDILDDFYYNVEWDDYK